MKKFKIITVIIIAIFMLSISVNAINTKNTLIIFDSYEEYNTLNVNGTIYIDGSYISQELSMHGYTLNYVDCIWYIIDAKTHEIVIDDIQSIIFVDNLNMLVDYYIDYTNIKVLIK